MPVFESASQPIRFRDKSGAWVDLALTLPVFLIYHLGVVFLKIRNASDIITAYILERAEGDLSHYLLITAAIGVAFVAVFVILGRGQAFAFGKFIQVAAEALIYATAMRCGAVYVVGRIFAAAGIVQDNPWVGMVMSLGAGFYEEMTYRVLLFGGGLKIILWIFVQQAPNPSMPPYSLRTTSASVSSVLFAFSWALISAAFFSGAHYIGPLADDFSAVSFVFRAVLGLMLTVIYAFRGFAAAVWTHAFYDIGVLVF
ncbi:type II CAAX prenyl endopeptidase Rce1 family protein [Pajaroellobacter abortibovis]|uniref:CAAX prenyl protease 2/Lysostaphin resistance protein A-like domain-containing protein n=1 Tax=Pajaroellobacter abortibovis TaxID=1882918 RepID=A0A1L6MUR9_9BACT|nr:CPBP family glutamic-type intramembrane protease [Pajaroellobacter abortibovis]APR99252.1 hypothetical protein BCY86_00115 [Pajaroellobacter abortibovis]